MKSITYALMLVAFTLHPLKLLATEYYVSPNGANDWSSCTNPSTTCSASDAMINAVAGDTVYFLSGVYLISGTPKDYQALLQPENSGSEGNNIVFKSLSKDDLAEIRSDCPDDFPNICRTIGTNGKNYITWDGFLLTSTKGKTAGVMIGKEEDSNNLLIQNIIVVAGPNLVTNKDNREIFRIEDVHDSVIRNNYLNGLKSPDSSDHPQNNACIKIYDSESLIIENNTIIGCPTGISAKRDMDNSIIRGNFLYHNYIGFWNEVLAYSNGTYFNSDNNSIYNNIFSNSTYMNLTIQGDRQASARNLKIFNNIFYSDLASTYLHVGVADGENISLYNNIFKGSGDAFHTTFSNSSIEFMGYNLYDMNSFIIQTKRYTPEHKTYTSLNEWKASSALSDGSSPGANSFTANIIFTNSSKSMSITDDFLLSDQSLTSNSGRFEDKIGANITQVGVSDLKIPKQPVVSIGAK